MNLIVHTYMHNWHSCQQLSVSICKALRDKMVSFYMKATWTVKHFSACNICNISKSQLFLFKSERVENSIGFKYTVAPWMLKWISNGLLVIDRTSGHCSCVGVSLTHTASAIKTAPTTKLWRYYVRTKSKIICDCSCIKRKSSAEMSGRMLQAKLVIYKSKPFSTVILGLFLFQFALWRGKKNTK